jgi:membrane-bound metal-dependent hydrolase YbcI (DUF457 family)
MMVRHWQPVAFAGRIGRKKVSDAGKHFVLGATLGGAAYLIFSWLVERELTWRGFFGSAFVGGVFALGPDFLEPALHPDHRQFFHSLAALGLLCYGNYRALTAPTLRSDGKLGVLVTSVGYAAHLLTDSVTPMSLPVLGRLGS